jgi:hypothetical protein
MVNVYRIDSLAMDRQSLIIAKLDENGKSYYFTSDVINREPDSLKDLKEVEVTVDPNNYRRYIVDTDNLSFPNTTGSV